MKYKIKFEKFLIATLFVLISLTVVQAQKNKQTQQDLIQTNDILERPISMPQNRCTIPKTAKTDLEFNCLKGNVHTVKSEFAVFAKKDGEYTKTDVYREIVVTYDKRGNLTERSTYDINNAGKKSIVHRMVYNFDSKGTATGWEEYSDGKQTPVVNIYTYDNKGKRIRQTVAYSESNVQAILLLNYDSVGNKIEERSYYPVPLVDGNEKISDIDEKYLHNIIRYKYKGKNLIETAFYKENDLISGKLLINYENGNKKEFIGYFSNKNGELISNGRTLLEYDQKGNVIAEINYKNDDSIKTREVKDYDDKGYLISHIVYDSEEKIKDKISFSYSYDSHDNWLSYTTDKINSNNRHQRELRTITYY